MPGKTGFVNRNLESTKIKETTVERIVAKRDIAAWLKGLAEKYEVVAPVKDGNTSGFKKVEDVSSLDLNMPTPPTKGLREQFTPETEVLFEYKLSGLQAELVPSELDTKDRLIFGARACDAAALKYVDAVYSNAQPVDAPYFARREHTALVGMFCTSPAWSCFCTEVNDFLTKPIEMDVYLTDIGEKYLAEALTPKGEELMGASQFQAASDADKQAAEAVRAKVLEKMPPFVDHALQSKSFDWDCSVWTKLAQKCLGCGACAFLCPTCHCFDIQEYAQGTKGSRYRCWDTCQFEKFTLMGHGHNPRPTKQERTRQRVFHKFLYSPERYGVLGCVGCGRCISSCPVNIDIQRVVHELESDTVKA